MEFITLGIGTPSDIPHFVLVGLSPAPTTERPSILAVVGAYQPILAVVGRHDPALDVVGTYSPAIDVVGLFED